VKFKLDENLPSRAADPLLEGGHDVETAQAEGLGGESDQHLAEAARSEGRAIVTLDRGFADIRAYPPGTHPGIVVLRLPDQRPGLVAEALRRLVGEHEMADLHGCVVVVQPNLIRIRRPATTAEP